MNTTTKGISLAVTMFAIVGMFSIAPAAASADDEGCTPGFWKANVKKGANAWPDNDSYTINPDDPLTDYLDAHPAINGVTFIEALNMRGGSGSEGAQEIFLRAASAALLNAAHDESDLDYEYSFDTELVPAINYVLKEASDNRQILLAFASALDDANNADCTFNNSGKPIRD